MTQSVVANRIAGARMRPWQNSGAPVSGSTAAADPTEEYTPVLYLESTDANTKSIDVRQFATWAYR